jgi:serine protease inhibitor
MRRQAPAPPSAALIYGATCTVLACASFLWLACASTRRFEGGEESDFPGQGTVPVRAGAESSSAGSATFYHSFACRLFQTAGGTGGNLLLSPHSISQSLAMVRAGAAGETARQMDALLQLPADAPAAYRSLLGTLIAASTAPAADSKAVPPEQGEAQAPGPAGQEDWLVLDDKAEYSFSDACAIFGQRGAGFAEPFLRSVQEGFGGELIETDFDESNQSIAAVNRWVTEKSEGRIQGALTPGVLGPETRMLLADVIHFKASWDQPFPEGRTAAGPFQVGPGRIVTAQRMRLEESLRYGETSEARMVRIPYRRGSTSMLIVLPRSTDGLDSLVRGLTPEKIRGWDAGMQERGVSLELPRFAFDSRLNLSAALKSMGMTDAFSPDKAEFPGISAREKLFLDALLHQGFVAVDERGTEAAAALVMVVNAGGWAERPVPFIVDHPFLFLIQQEETGAILFMGRVVDPTAG